MKKLKRNLIQLLFALAVVALIFGIWITAFAGSWVLCSVYAVQLVAIFAFVFYFSR